MAYRMRSLSKSRKAQFFILSAFVIVSIVYVISKWLEPYTIIDTSEIVLREETFVFNNIVEKTDEAIESTKSYGDLSYNLQEYRSFVKDYASQKNFALTLDYGMVPTIGDIPTGVSMSCIRIKSPKMTLENAHVVNWP